jgi:glycosyltransferase involved in cell wall biosynthesis
MATGLPSIGFSDCPGTNQLIQHEKNGLLALPEDRVTSLENAMRKLMSSAAMRARMGRQALEDSKAFDPNRIYDQWETLFLEAAEYKKDPGRLLREQVAIDPERALHAQRCRKNVLKSVRGRI